MAKSPGVFSLENVEVKLRESIGDYNDKKNDIIVKRGKRYLPCLESDYNSALNDNIPERWLRAVKRI